MPVSVGWFDACLLSRCYLSSGWISSRSHGIRIILELFQGLVSGVPPCRQMLFPPIAPVSRTPGSASDTSARFWLIKPFGMGL